MSDIDTAIMNNRHLVGMMFVELEYIRHVVEVEALNNDDFAEMPMNLEKMPSFTVSGINKNLKLALDGEYPVSMLDSTQKERLMFYIHSYGYPKVHEVARQTVNVWKQLG